MKRKAMASTPGETVPEPVLRPVGTRFVFDLRTPVPRPSGAGRTGRLLSDLDRGVRPARWPRAGPRRRAHGLCAARIAAGAVATRRQGSGLRFRAVYVTALAGLRLRGRPFTSPRFPRRPVWTTSAGAIAVTGRRPRVVHGPPLTNWIRRIVIALPDRDHDLLLFPVDGRIELTARVTMERV